MIESDFGTMCIQDVTLSFAHVGHNWTDLWCLELLFVCFFLQFTLMFNVLPSFCCFSLGVLCRMQVGSCLLCLALVQGKEHVYFVFVLIELWACELCCFAFVLCDCSKMLIHTL